MLRLFRVPLFYRQFAVAVARLVRFSSGVSRRVGRRPPEVLECLEFGFEIFQAGLVLGFQLLQFSFLIGGAVSWLRRLTGPYSSVWAARFGRCPGGERLGGYAVAVFLVGSGWRRFPGGLVLVTRGSVQGLVSSVQGLVVDGEGVEVTAVPVAWVGLAVVVSRVVADVVGLLPGGKPGVSARCSPAGQRGQGKVTSMSRPPWGRGLAVMEALWASAMARTMARPRPCPSPWRMRWVPSCRNG